MANDMEHTNIHNIAHTNVHKLFQSLVANKEHAYNIQIDCSRMIQKEEDRVKDGKVTCKSGSKKHIKYLKRQVEIQFQRENLYDGLIKAIEQGDYVDE
jgi:hypothetical protein